MIGAMLFLALLIIGSGALYIIIDSTRQYRDMVRESREAIERQQEESHDRPDRTGP